MNKIPFDRSELNAIGQIPGMRPWEPPIPVFNTPISRKENFMRFLKGEDPMWMPSMKEVAMVSPACVPDNWARGMVSVPGRPPIEKLGGKDMFGVEWEYLPDDHASMVRPGTHPVKDLDEWESFVTMPDVDSWDWEGSAKAIEDKLNDGRLVMCAFMNGLFERLVSLTGMEDALIALIDEEYEDAVHRLFDTLCVIYDKILFNMKKYYHADMVWFHDDWGTQRAPFFACDTVEEMLFPYLKRVTESAHKYGMIMNFHSCGKVESLVPLMIEAGADMWDGQPLNDKEKVLRENDNRIICNSNPKELPPEASREEESQAVAEFLEKYKGLRVYAGLHHIVHPAEHEELYVQSRILFSQEK